MERRQRLPEGSYISDSYDENDFSDVSDEEIQSITEEEEVDDGNPYNTKFDMMKHIEGLLPGNIIDGKPTGREASRAHLDALKPPDTNINYCYYLSYAYRRIKERREIERRKRKNHILIEFENKIKKYDMEQKKQLEMEIKKLEREVAKAAYQSNKLLQYNSKEVNS